MTDKLNRLHLLRNHSSWVQYQQEVATGLVASQDAGSVSFTSEPNRFPCLTAAVIQATEPTVANNFKQYAVNCCFVYPDDATRLLVAAEKPTDLTPVDQLSSACSRQSESSEYVPTQMGVLLLALVNEMDAVGALHRDKLLAEVAFVNNWLHVNKTANIEDDSLTGVLQRMWKDKDAGEF
jgi:hypothetical protein